MTEDVKTSKQVLMASAKTFLCGLCIGIANAIPGVSGGTMAVILRVFDEILYAISPKHLKEHLAFLIPLGCGAIAGIFALSKVIVGLLETHAMLLDFCFIGLILGSIPSIYKRARGDKAKPRNLIFGTVAFAFMVALSFVNEGTMASASGADWGDLNLVLGLWLFLTVFVSTIAMILPGISGSLLLLLFGVYTIVMGAIEQLDLPLLAIICVAVLAGLFFGIKIIKKMLRFHPQALYFVILGLVAGSIFSVYSGFSPSAEGFLSLGGMVVFGALAYFLSSRK